MLKTAASGVLQVYTSVRTGMRGRNDTECGYRPMNYTKTRCKSNLNQPGKDPCPCLHLREPIVFEDCILEARGKLGVDARAVRREHLSKHAVSQQGVMAYLRTHRACVGSWGALVYFLDRKK